MKKMMKPPKIYPQVNFEIPPEEDEIDDDYGWATLHTQTYDTFPRSSLCW
jgi:hypothetical protein